jgi:hypothetical protein
MSEYTLGQIHERITEIDSTIFKAETAQITLADDEYRSLKIEVEALMQVLAENLAKETGRTVAEAYADRKKIRDLDWIELTCKRHREIYPEPVPAHDAIIASAFGDEKKSSEQVGEELNRIFGYMFVNHQPKPIPKKGFFRRLFS